MLETACVWLQRASLKGLTAAAAEVDVFCRELPVMGTGGEVGIAGQLLAALQGCQRHILGAQAAITAPDGDIDAGTCTRARY